MSDLGSGRATNGGSRSTGPVPVSAGTTTPIRTPRDVMRDRNAREARRLEEQKAEEQRRVAEERRRSAERRAAAVTGAPARYSEASSQYTPDAAALQGQFDAAGDRRSRIGAVAGTDALGEPVGRTTQDYPATRTRSAAQDQPRPAQPLTSGVRRTQQSQAAPRPPPTPTAAGTNPSTQATAQPSAGTATASSFPHAFERWENLSAHWEGLTSYWLHKLEQNTEEIRNVVPNATTLNRQITDLSAAGANLFHAVVELQRLRASSERKFQRWFFETRADTERNQEQQAQVEQQLRLERSAREEFAQKQAEAEESASLARRELAEMQRELTISKEEARRAWEELGRRNQEYLETAESLKSGGVTLVAGIRVIPYFGGPSRTGSASQQLQQQQRPTTREGQQQYYGSVASGTNPAATGMQSPGDERQYYRQDLSPTNTDPFTEPAPPQQTTTKVEPISSGLAGRSDPPVGSPAIQVSKPAPASREQDLYLADPVTSAQPGAEQAMGNPSTSTRRRARPREDVRSEESYVDTLSEGDTEYAIDPAGNIRRDATGRPVVFRRRPVAGQRSDVDDEELAARYEPGSLPEAPSVPSTSAQAMATFAPPTAEATTSANPDYEGSDYGNWEAVQTRHHHPTRLSDVLEEEEERSSRRTVE